MKISIANAKGGVGKTTTSIITALFLSKDKKVLLIDLDPQSNSTDTLLNLKIGTSLDEFTFYNVLEKYLKNKKDNIIKDVIKQVNENLYLVPACLEMEQLKDLIKIKSREPLYILSELLKPIENDYDFIILDCPADLSIFVENAIKVSDLIICPTILDDYGIRALNMMLPTILDIKGEDFENYKILYTLFNSRATKIESKVKNYVNKLEKNNKVFDFRIPQDQQIRNWQSVRNDFVNDKAYEKSKARKEYEKLYEYLKGLENGRRN
jgi:chromosome partitioning protein